MPSDKFLPTAITRPTAPTLNKPYLRTPYLYKTGFPTKKPKNYLFDYNNPYEDNSLLDVVVNAFDSENPFKYVIDGGFDLIKRGTIDPIKAGHFGTAALNNLMMFAETMDVVAAPTKALLQGRGLDAAAKAWGIGTHGRYNYDWDTGNIISDIMLEVLTDPINWVTLGLKGAVTGAAKSTIKKGAKDAALLTTFTDDSVYRKLSHQLVKSYLKQDTPQMMADAKRLYGALEKSGKVKLAEGNTIDDMVKVLQKAEAVAKESPGYTINKSLNRLVGGVESFERGLFRAAFTPSGLYPSWFLMKKGYTAANLMLKNRISDVLKHYQRPDGTYSLSVISDLMATTKDVNDVFEALTKIKEGTEDIPKETIHALQKGVRNDVTNLTAIIKENKDNPGEMERLLQEYMWKMNGVDSVEAYLEIIKVADQILKGEFYHSAKSFEEILEYRQAVHNHQALRFSTEESKQTREYIGAMYKENSAELDELVIAPTRRVEMEELLHDKIHHLAHASLTPKSRRFTPYSHKKVLRGLRPHIEEYFKEIEAQIQKIVAGFPPEMQKEIAEALRLDFRALKADIMSTVQDYVFRLGTSINMKEAFDERYMMPSPILRSRAEKLKYGAIVEEEEFEHLMEEVFTNSIYNNPAYVPRSVEVIDQDFVGPQQIFKTKTVTDDVLIKQMRFRDTESVKFVRNPFESAYKTISEQLMKIDKSIDEMGQKLKDFESSAVFQDLLNSPGDMKKVQALLRTVNESALTRARRMEETYIPYATKTKKEYKVLYRELQQYLKDNPLEEDDVYSQEIVYSFLEVYPIITQKGKDFLNPDYAVAHKKLSQWLGKQQDALVDAKKAAADRSAEARLWEATHEGSTPYVPGERIEAALEPVERQVGKGLPAKELPSELYAKAVKKDLTIEESVDGFRALQKEIEKLTAAIERRFGKTNIFKGLSWKESFQLNPHLEYGDWYRSFTEHISKAGQKKAAAYQDMIEELQVMVNTQALYFYSLQKHIDEKHYADAVKRLHSKEGVDPDSVPSLKVGDLIKQLQDKQEVLKSLRSKLEAMTPERISDVMVDLNEASKWVGLKTESSHVQLQLSVLGPVGEFMRAIQAPETRIGAYLQTIKTLEELEDGVPKEYREAYESAAKLLEAAERHNIYADTLAKLSANPEIISENYRSAFVSTLQGLKYQKMNPEQFLEGGPAVQEFLTQMELNMRSLFGNQRYNLESIRAYVDDWGKHLDEGAVNKVLNDAHTADADAYTLAMYMMATHKSEIQKHLDDGRMVWFVDIETAGLSANNKEILEIAGSTPGGQTFCYTRNMSQAEANRVEDSLIRALFGHLPLEEQRAAFNKRYVRPHEKLNTEADILKAYFDEVSMGPGGVIPTKYPVLYAHHGAAFDFPFIMKRAHNDNVALSIPISYHGALKQDTLEMMLKADEAVHLTTDARDLITKVLSNHGQRMLNAGGHQMVDNAAGETLTNIRNITGYIRNTLDDIKDPIERAKANDAQNLFEQAATDILTVLQGVSRHNNLFNHSLLADPFSMSTTQTREEAILRLAGEMGKSTKEIKDMFGYNAEGIETVATILKGKPELQDLLKLDTDATKAEIMQAVYREFGDNVNLPRLLAWGTKRGEINYRKLIEEELLRKYFQVPEDGKMPFKRANALTRIAQQLERQYEGVKNMNLLNKLAPDIQKALKGMKDSPIFLSMHPATADILRSFNWESNDVITQFLILKRLWQMTNRPSEPGEEWLKVYSAGPELDKLIKEPDQIFSKAVYRDTATQYEVLARRAATELESSPGILMDAIRDLDLRVKGLEDLGRELDNGISASKMFAVANALQGITKAKRYIDKLDDAQQHRVGKLLHDWKNEQGLQQVINLLSDTLQNPRHLLSTLVWETPVIRYSIRNNERNIHVRHLTKELLSKAAELEEMGIQLVEGKEMMFIYLKDAATGIKETKHKLKYKKKNFTRSYMGQDVEAPVHRELTHKGWAGEEFKELEELLEKSRKDLHQLSQGRSVGSTAELMTPKRFADYYAKLPQNVQSGMGELELLLKEEKWQGMRYDWTNLGTVEVKRGLDDFAYKTPLGALSNALEYTAALTESKALYLDLYFNPSTGINTGLLKDASDQDIVDALKRNPEFILAALVTSKSKASDGYRVVRLDVNTADDVAKARKLNATILPYQVFATSHQTLNTGQFSSTFLNFWHKIIYTYKVGYLLDPGVILRNYVDSFAKNVVSDDGNIREVAVVQGRAMHMLNQYNKSLQAILALGHQKYNPDNLHLYFSRINPEDSGFTEEQFRFIHGFIAYSASAGMTGPWQKYLKDRNLAAGMIDEEHNIWNSFVAFSDFLMTPNKWTEQINRLTQYMILEEQGYTRTQIFKRIADTHFDYNVKTVPEMYAELVFPFYTFTMRNLEYWINAVSQKPWLMNMFKDIMTPIWNFDGYTQDELGRNRSLQYQLLSGNLQPFADNGSFTLKLNPSYMDVYNLAVDVPNSMLSLLLAGELTPEAFGSIIGKMSAPMQVGVDLGFELRGGMAAGLFDLQSNSGESTLIDTLVNTLPIIGAAKVRYEQGGKYAERTGFDWQKAPLTQGTFGGTQRWEPRKPYVKKQKNYYYDKGDTSSGYTYRTYHRKYYPSNYPARGKNLYYDSFYRKHYTKKGVSKFKLRMMPYTADNLAYRIKDMYWYFK